MPKIKVMLSTFVKVSHVSSLSDARYCAGMMVDMLGFNLESTSPHFVSIQKFQEITQWVSGPAFVGEFGDLPEDEVLTLAKSYELDHLETTQWTVALALLDANFQVVYRPSLKSEGELAELLDLLPIIKATNLLLILNVDLALLDHVINSEIASHSLIQIATETDLKSKKSEAFKGIELEAMPEERPGFQDYGLLMDILEKLDA